MVYVQGLLVWPMAEAVPRLEAAPYEREYKREKAARDRGGKLVLRCRCIVLPRQTLANASRELAGRRTEPDVQSATPPADPVPGKSAGAGAGSKRDAQSL